MEGRKVGSITHYFNKIGVAVIELIDTLKEGDTIRIKGATTNFDQVVKSMQIEHKNVEEATEGQSIGLKVKSVVRAGDEVFVLEDEEEEIEKEVEEIELNEDFEEDFEDEEE